MQCEQITCINLNYEINTRSQTEKKPLNCQRENKNIAIEYIVQLLQTKTPNVLHIILQFPFEGVFIFKELISVNFTLFKPQYKRDLLLNWKRLDMP